jgi:hypothetical protein
MKAKLIACLVLFLSFSLVSWSQPTGNRAAQSAVPDSPGWSALPSCLDDETGGRIMARRGYGDTTRPNEFVLPVTDNPLEAVFFEVSCLLASNL